MSTEHVTWDSLDWTFGDRIRKIRRAVNASQGDFAAALGETRESLSTWESGRVAQPRNVVAIAKRIELAYGVPATWTLGLETKRPGPSGPGLSKLPGLDSDQQPFGTGLGQLVQFPTSNHTERLAA